MSLIKEVDYGTPAKNSEKTVTLTIDGKDVNLSKGESIDIAEEQAHRMANNDDEDLTFIEIQQGEYFGEDDIVRLEDDYGRESTCV